jgi:hypothetical protein
MCVSVARQVFVMRRVAEKLHARRRHEHLLLQLQSLVFAFHTDVCLDAEDHSFLDLTLVMIGEHEDRVFVAEATSVRDERVPFGRGTSPGNGDSSVPQSRRRPRPGFSSLMISARNV